MRRRDFLKGLAGISAGVVFINSKSFGAPQKAPRQGKLPVSKQETGVFLAGVPKGASEAALKGAVREAALAVSDFSWLSRGDSVFIKDLGAFDGADHTDVSIISSSLRDGVNMGSRHDRGKFRVGSFSSADNVAGGIDPDA